MKSIKKNNEKRTFSEVAKDTLEYMYSNNVLSAKRTDRESLEQFTNIVYENLERNNDVESKAFLIKSEIIANGHLLDGIVDDILNSDDCETVVKSAIARYTCKSSPKSDLYINQTSLYDRRQITRVSYAKKGDVVEKMDDPRREDDDYGYVYRSQSSMDLCEDEEN